MPDVLTNHWLERFRILRRAGVQVDGADAEALPPFFGIFISVMQGQPEKPVCFVLPRRGDAARLVAVLFGLEQFLASQRNLALARADSALVKGDIVRIHPSRHVFRFAGFSDLGHHLICLRTLNGPDSERWTLQASEVLPRIEKTTLTRPMGKFNCPIHSPKPPLIDALLGTSTFGNQSLFRNEVAILDSLSGFKAFCQSTLVLDLSSDTAPSSIKDLVPLGGVVCPASSQAVSLEKWDERHPVGAPLVAATHSAEDLASLCVTRPQNSLQAVINGLSKLKESLQSFDDIRDTQRLVLFAEDSEKDLIAMVADRGCSLWPLTDRELEPPSSGFLAKAGCSVQLQAWARNKYLLDLSTELCKHESLDAVALQLESLRDAISRDDVPALTQLVARAWRLLNDTASAYRPLTMNEQTLARARVTALRESVSATAAWLTTEMSRTLMSAADGLEAAFPTAGTEKGLALERTIDHALDSGDTCAVYVKEHRVPELARWIRSHRRWNQVQVHSHQTLRDQWALDRLICLSWPGTDTMEALVTSCSTLRIILLGHSFECRWLVQFAKRLGRQSLGTCLTSKEKAALVWGAGTERDWLPDSEQEKVPAPASLLSTEDIYVFEQRLKSARKGISATPTDASEVLPARYVSFTGDSYAFLTGGHKVVVVSALLSTQAARKTRPPERVVADLKVGDFIVFPESGDRELIHAKADQILGTEAPRLRATAHLWKDALAACRIRPEDFLRHASELKRGRHIVTIRKWFAETQQIGPGLSNDDLTEDLELIALVTDYGPLKEGLPAVAAAIKELRSAHLSAGSRLRDVLIDRLPEGLGRVDEEETMVDLGDVGSAWIVQIESLATDVEPRGRTEVNRLLRDDRIPGFIF